MITATPSRLFLIAFISCFYISSIFADAPQKTGLLAKTFMPQIANAQQIMKEWVPLFDRLEIIDKKLSETVKYSDEIQKKLDAKRQTLKSGEISLDVFETWPVLLSKLYNEIRELKKEKKELLKQKHKVELKLRELIETHQTQKDEVAKIDMVLGAI